MIGWCRLRFREKRGDEDFENVLVLWMFETVRLILTIGDFCEGFFVKKIDRGLFFMLKGGACVL